MWLAVAAVVAAGVCGVAYQTVVGKRKASAPYRMALEAVQGDPGVVAALGEPVRDVTWFPQGTIDERELGEARWDFDVAGPKNSAHVRVTARFIGGRWSLQQLEVTPSGSQPIKIDVRASEHSEDAPLWTPPAGAKVPTGGQPAPGGKSELGQSERRDTPPASQPAGPEIQAPQIQLPIPDTPTEQPPKIELSPPTLPR